MEREGTRTGRRWFGGIVLAVAMMVGLLPGLATAGETFFGKIVLWEVQEYLRLKSGSHQDNLAFRLANATLVGDATDGLCAGTGLGECAMDARARSTVSLTTGEGPISGAFNILVDSNPASPLLSDLVLVATGTLEGRLDLSPALLFMATQGKAGAPVAPAQGRWKSRELGARGGFTGAFLIPIPSAEITTLFGLPDCARGFAYFNPTAVPLVLECLGDPDFSLGIPVTKFVGILTAR